MNGFCLKEGQGLKASTVHPPPKLPLSPPPLPPRGRGKPRDPNGTPTSTFRALLDALTPKLLGVTLQSR